MTVADFAARQGCALTALEAGGWCGLAAIAVLSPKPSSTDSPLSVDPLCGIGHSANMQAIAIRAAQPDDLADLYHLLRAKADFDGALPALTATKADLGRAIFCEDPGCKFVVAELDGKLVGFAAYYPVFSTYAAKPGLWMDDLFVDETLRSLGIGKRLLQFLAAEAVRMGCCKLEWSLQTSNVRGIAFYEREGAVIREENRFAKLDESGLERLLAR